MIFKLNQILTLLLFVLISLISTAQAEHADSLHNLNNEDIQLKNNEKIKAPGTSVFIVPPKHFEEKRSANGFIHKGSSTIIQIQEIEGIGYKKTIKKLDHDHFKSQDFKLKEEKDIKLNDGEKAHLFIAEYIAENEKYERLMLFTGKESTIWVNVNYPAIVKPLIYKPVIASLKTISR